MMNLRSARSVRRATPKFDRACHPLLVVAALAVPSSSARALDGVSGFPAGPNYEFLTAAARACSDEVPGKSPLQIALRHYVKGAEPIPRRFLTAVTGDSAMSEMGTKVLGEYGPTYYYGGTETAKAALREKLERVGPSPALLVVVRTNKKLSATTQEIRLGGHYVSGEFDGKLATSRQYTIACSATGWVIKDTKVEPAP